MGPPSQWEVMCWKALLDAPLNLRSLQIYGNIQTVCLVLNKVCEPLVSLKVLPLVSRNPMNVCSVVSNVSVYWLFFHWVPCLWDLRICVVLCCYYIFVSLLCLSEGPGIACLPGFLRSMMLKSMKDTSIIPLMSISKCMGTASFKTMSSNRQ